MASASYFNPDFLSPNSLIAFFFHEIFKAVPLLTASNLCSSSKQSVLHSNLSFLLVSYQPVKSIIHALGHNRARQRDKLAHLLEEFGALQDEVIICLCEWFESRSHPVKC